MARKSLNPYVLLGIGIAGVTTYLVKEENRNRTVNTMHQLKQVVMNALHRKNGKMQENLMEKAGHPNPFDLGDSEMVSEGAMYSVKYYNDKEK